MDHMKPVIIDTDPGVDDAFAICLAAASTELNLLGVTTVFGNVDLAQTTRNALRVLRLCGKPDVPVAAGADRPLVHPKQWRESTAHGTDGLSGKAGTLTDRARGTAPDDAVTLLVRLLRESPEPVTIIAIGPLTNIALLLAAHPGARDKIARLVIMGGGVAGGNVTPSAEFNLWSDPEAARRVLVEESLPTVLVPLDVTRQCAVDQAWLAALSGSGPLGATLVGLTAEYQAHYRRSLGWDGMVLHDAVAVVAAIAPDLLHRKAFPVDVDCTFGPARGALLVDQRAAAVVPDRPQRTVEIALGAEVDAVRQLILRRLSG